MRQIQDLKTGAVAYLSAVVLVGCAAAFMAFAAYLELSRTMAPVLAAMVVGIALLLLAGAAILIARWVTRRRAARGEAVRDNPFDELESALGQRVDPAVGAWIRRHPERAALATVVLGVAAGYSGSVRHVLQDLFHQYVEEDTGKRRARKRA